METIRYRTLEVPHSLDVDTPDDITDRVRDVLTVYDTINGRNYDRVFDSLPNERAFELLPEFDNQECVIAYDTDERQTAGVINFNADTNKDWMWVTGVAVDAQYRGLGIGINLMRHVETLGRERSLGAVALRSVPNAIPFYEKRGFELYAEGFQPVYRKQL